VGKRDDPANAAPFPTGALLKEHLVFRESNRLDHGDANRPGGGVQNSSHFHALVKEVLGLLLVVELFIAVSLGRDLCL